VPAFSIVIIAQDAERTLAWSLESAKGADELLVVDGGSRDRTREIAAAAGAKVLERPFDDYSSQKNFANASAAYDWVFSLDADEALDPELAKALRSWRETPPPAGVSGFRIDRRSYFLERWVRHSGWWPDRSVRLFDRRRARWEGMVHERLTVQGKQRDLPGHLIHCTYADPAEQARRLDRYAALWAREQQSRGRKGSYLRLVGQPPWAFIGRYVLRCGLLDGRAGLLIAWAQARHVFRREALLLQQRDGAPAKPPAGSR